MVDVGLMVVLVKDGISIKDLFRGIAGESDLNIFLLSINTHYCLL